MFVWFDLAWFVNHLLNGRVMALPVTGAPARGASEYLAICDRPGGVAGEQKQLSKEAGRLTRETARAAGKAAAEVGKAVARAVAATLRPRKRPMGLPGSGASVSENSVFCSCGRGRGCHALAEPGARPAKWATSSINLASVPIQLLTPFGVGARSRLQGNRCLACRVSTTLHPETLFTAGQGPSKRPKGAAGSTGPGAGEGAGGWTLELGPLPGEGRPWKGDPAEHPGGLLAGVLASGRGFTETSRNREAVARVLDRVVGKLEDKLERKVNNNVHL